MCLAVSRYVSECAPRLLLQALYEPPLALGDGVSRQVDVEEHQLGLVIQPLHHKYWTCDQRYWPSDTATVFMHPWREAQCVSSLTFYQGVDLWGKETLPLLS